MLQQASAARAIQTGEETDKSKLKNVIRVDDLQVLHAMSNLKLVNVVMHPCRHASMLLVEYHDLECAVFLVI